MHEIHYFQKQICIFIYLFIHSSVFLIVVNQIHYFINLLYILCYNKINESDVKKLLIERGTVEKWDVFEVKFSTNKEFDREN